MASNKSCFKQKEEMLSKKQTKNNKISLYKENLLLKMLLSSFLMKIYKKILPHAVKRKKGTKPLPAPYLLASLALKWQQSSVRPNLWAVLPDPLTSRRLPWVDLTLIGWGWAWMRPWNRLGVPSRSRSTVGAQRNNLMNTISVSFKRVQLFLPLC